MTTDLISISVDNGKVERIANLPYARNLLRASQDERFFYLVNDRGKGPDAEPKYVWDRRTHKETAVADHAEVGDSAWTLSLDERWIMRQLNGNLSFRPTTGGKWKTLASGIENFYMLGSTPDGGWAMYLASDQQGNPGIFEAPFLGGNPRRLGDLPANYLFAYGQLVFSSDGRKVLAWNFGPPQHALWILENFEPHTSK